MSAIDHGEMAFRLSLPSSGYPNREPSEPEREVMSGPLSRGVAYRLCVKGRFGPREIGKLILMLQAQKEVLEEGDGRLIVDDFGNMVEVPT